MISPLIQSPLTVNGYSMEVIQHSMGVPLRQNDITRTEMLSDLTVVDGRRLETINAHLKISRPYTGCEIGDVNADSLMGVDLLGEIGWSRLTEGSALTRGLQ
ncbi:hypothetical protein PRIPAC_84416 [Pristionchus pacificus]|uniref:Uncharacterized protein n=1 Tax=Pristionchus pacificus TaxID=54126 RepID=A0A2A6BGP9_PRIPA|nr:hypothetical protein PRIPAC_84416 [Pristionchus pacificus]|eukprot:PDM65062.1 hypothetical protein PRIPAC_53311 [Pristionchus pacificus]